MGNEAAAGAAPLDPPTQGMWYDPARNGHGFDLQRQGETWFFVFYTYGPEGLPEWRGDAFPLCRHGH